MMLGVWEIIFRNNHTMMGTKEKEKKGQQDTMKEDPKSGCPASCFSVFSTSERIFFMVPNSSEAGGERIRAWP